MKRARLDVLLVERGLAPTRERARALVLAGQVAVNGSIVSKAGTAVERDATLSLQSPDHPWVGRGGIKLAHALDAFQIEVSGRRALDIGASTGGFTDVLLQRGAAHVTAVDVGHGQLDWKLRRDPRVLVREGVNARRLSRADLPEPVAIVVVDVAFISLRHIFPVLPALLSPDADIVALVKPQFEAGRRDVRKGGLVLDPDVHDAVLRRVTEEAAASALDRVAMVPSPITGATGNQEFFLHLRARESQPPGPARAGRAPADVG